MLQIAFSGALSPANILFFKHLAEKGKMLLTGIKSWRNLFFPIKTYNNKKIHQNS
jgi:hypothetical protein